MLNSAALVLRSLALALSCAGLALGCASNDKTDHPTVTGGDQPSQVAAALLDGGAPHLPGEGDEATPEYDINRMQAATPPKNTPIDQLVEGSRPRPRTADAGARDAGTP
ncbi:MAG TPA: hypothetical protein VG963_06750 [Polyangiaceae bacterium]|nr:hypothetical protein [Polyangiaceae bacterium]